MHFLGVLMVQSLPEINLILNISVSAPACIIAQHKDHKMHPRTKVTIQIIKRGIRTIFVQIHLACLLAESQTFYQRGKNIIHLGCISMFHYISSLYYSRVKHASVGEMQSKASSAWCPLFQSKVRVQRLNL